jgi:hypothetical protein
LHSHFAKAFVGGVLAQSHLRNRDPRGSTATPISVALLKNGFEILELLISAGADVNAVFT